MPLDILTIGEALVEVMRTDIDQPLDQWVRSYSSWRYDIRYAKMYLKLF